MKKLSKDKQQKLLAIIMATGLVVVGMWNFVIYYAKTRLELAEKSVESRTAELRKMDNNIKSSGLILTNLTRETERLKTEESGLAFGRNLNDWADRTLTRLQRDYGSNVTFISTYDPKGPNDVTDVPNWTILPPPYLYKSAKISIHGRAYFWDFGAFLADFENHNPYQRILNLNLAAPEGSSQDKTGAPRVISPGAPESSDPEKLDFFFDLVSLYKGDFE